MSTGPNVPGLAATLLLALGPSSRVDTLPELLATTRARPAAELLVVEEGCSIKVRTALAALTGNVRVRHDPYPFGTRGALAAGATMADGAVLVLLAEDAVVTAAALDDLLAAFDDPGVGMVELADASGAVGALALRRGALMSVGGPRALAGPPDAVYRPGARVALRDPELAARLAGAEWRRAERLLECPTSGSLPSWPAAAETADPGGPAPWTPPRPPAVTRRGVNVIGFLEAVCGLGDAGRRYAEAVARCSLPSATFSWHGHASPHTGFRHRGDGTLAHSINLLAMNATDLQSFVGHSGPELFANHYNIGLWFWELEMLHEHMYPALPLVHELWVSTGFLEQAFTSHTDKPVVRIPLPVPRREGEPAATKADLGLPEAFSFLVVFDFKSLALRKNSIAAVRAFCQAFEPGEGPVLVLKTAHASDDPGGWRALDAARAGRRDIILLDANLTDEGITALVGRADCLVSLHRSEGFGLCLADAMAWGRPVVATGFSGNLEFMTEDNSYLVPHGWSHVPTSLGPIYPAGARWAEPDIDVAAAHLRAVWTDQAASRARGARGQADIRRTNSLAAATQAIEHRLQELARRHPTPRRRAGARR